MRYLAVAVFAMLALTPACKKEEKFSCPLIDYIFTQSYSTPVWHPNGELLGFNHTPLKPITRFELGECSRFSYVGNFDSTGFYFMNKDKTGFRRATRFGLQSPAWSPDGKWIAFVDQQHIYKMPFNGSTLDTTQKIQLTTEGYNTHAVWTANSDTIYYSSSLNGPVGTNLHALWKMASDGTGKIKLTDATTLTSHIIEISLGSDNRIYHNRWVDTKIGISSSILLEIFSMNKDGSNLSQLTTSVNQMDNMGGRRFAKYRQGKIYYQANDGIYVFTPGASPTRIINEQVNTFDISVNGELVYSRFSGNERIKDEQMGTLWITNLEGGNKRQLTFNRVK